MTHFHEYKYNIKLKWTKGIKKYHSIIYKGVGSLVTSKRTYLNIDDYKPDNDEIVNQNLIVPGTNTSTSNA